MLHVNFGVIVANVKVKVYTFLIYRVYLSNCIFSSQQEGIHSLKQTSIHSLGNQFSISLISCLTWKDHDEHIQLEESELKTPSNFMDHWILSFTQSLIKFVKEEMAGKNTVENFLYWI